MAKITYIEFNGTEHVVDVANGLSVLIATGYCLARIHSRPAITIAWLALGES